MQRADKQPPVVFQQRTLQESGIRSLSPSFNFSFREKFLFALPSPKMAYCTSWQRTTVGNRSTKHQPRNCRLSNAKLLTFREIFCFFDENFILSAFYIKNLFACRFDKLDKKICSRIPRGKKRFILILPHRRDSQQQKAEKSREVMRRFWLNEEQKLLFGSLSPMIQEGKSKKKTWIQIVRFCRHTMIAYVASIVCRFQPSNCG